MDNFRISLPGNTAKGRVARQVEAMKMDDDVVRGKAMNLFNTKSLSFRHIEDAMDIARRDEREKLCLFAADPSQN